MANLPNPLNCLSDSARRRIDDASLEGQQIRARALAGVEARYDAESKAVGTFSQYCRKGQAAIKINQAKLESVRLILAAMLLEYKGAGKSGTELRQIMYEEFDGLATSAELTTLEREAEMLSMELDLYRQTNSEVGSESGGLAKTKKTAGDTKPGRTEPARGQSAEAEHGGDRRAAVDAFIRKCEQQLSRKLNREDIWRAAKHKTARQFQYWQKSDPKATAQDNRNFRRILAMNPTDFETLLKGKT